MTDKIYFLLSNNSTSKLKGDLDIPYEFKTVLKKKYLFVEVRHIFYHLALCHKLVYQVYLEEEPEVYQNSIGTFHASKRATLGEPMLLNSETIYYLIDLGAMIHIDNLYYYAIGYNLLDFIYYLTRECQQSDLNRLLFLASVEHNEIVIRHLIECGADINYSEGDSSILSNLINYDHVSICRELINIGAEVNTKQTRKGFQSVIYCVNDKLINFYLDFGLDLDLLIDPEINLLHPLLKIDTIKRLLEHGANINYFLERNLINAAMYNKLEFIKLVFTIKGEYPNNDQFLKELFQGGNYDCTVFMIETGLVLREEPVCRGISEYYNTFAHPDEASRILEYLVSKGLDVSPHLDMMLINVCTHCRHIQLTRKLLELGANVSVDLIRQVVSHLNFVTVSFCKLLLEYGTDYSPDLLDEWEKDIPKMWKELSKEGW